MHRWEPMHQKKQPLILNNNNQISLCLNLLQQQEYQMGRKGKQLTINWYLQMHDCSQYMHKEANIIVQSNVLRYTDLSNARYQFLSDCNYPYENYMHYVDQKNTFILIDDKFQFSIDKLPKHQNSFALIRILIRSFAQMIKQQFDNKIQDLRMEMQSLKELIDDLPKKEQIFAQKQRTVYASKSFLSNPLDVGFLFSEPIFDQEKDKSAGSPVGFRSQIKRLKHSLKNGFIQDVNLRYERATLGNMKSMITHFQPKILHISCHGQENGSLKFQDDSQDKLGILRRVKPEQILRQLQQCTTNLPEIVFINSCHSENAGKSFIQLGVRYVITINSADQIKDQAAQIFSEHFYRNIFKGELVSNAFQSAKREVYEALHDVHSCCCYHNGDSHKSNCLWKQLQKKIPNVIQALYQAHNIYHIPLAQCKCSLKHQNQHDIKCKWARKIMYAINQDYAIIDTLTKQKRQPRNLAEIKKFLIEDKLMLCCCFEPGKIPHSQSQKFKLYTKVAIHEPLYKVISRTAITPEVIDSSSPQLLEANQKLPKTIKGRQKQLSKFFKLIFKQYPYQNVFFLLGPSGCGKTTFITKAGTYMFERKAISALFYIDLFGIHDKGMFKYKFAEVTKLNFEKNQCLAYCRDKIFFIILDNCDEFLGDSAEDFYETIQNVRQHLKGSKIILVCKKETYQNQYKSKHLLSQKFQLGPLNIVAAAYIMYYKLRDRFSSKVQFCDILAFMQSQKNLQNPKVIETICQALKNENKIDIDKIDKIIKQKLKHYRDIEKATEFFIKDNIDKLKIDSTRAFELLLFISQFSQGVGISDLHMFSFCDKFEKFPMPIKGTYLKDLKVLNQKRFNQQSKINAESQHSEGQNQQIEQYTQFTSLFPSDSYFLSKISQSKIMVKKYLREYINNKFKDPTIYQIKYIFVAYICVMLEVVLDLFKKEYYFHDQIISYDSVSVTMSINYNTNIRSLYQQNLTRSADIALAFQKQLQRILNQNKQFQQKLRQTDPTIFISNHKQDFLNMYNVNWKQIYKYFQDNNAPQLKIFLIFYVNVLAHIPTALRIAKADIVLQQYLINKSLKTLSKMKQQALLYIPDVYCKIVLKLYLLKIQCQLENGDKISLKQIEIAFEEMKSRVSEMKNKHSSLKYLTKLLEIEQSHIYLYYEYKTCKDRKKLLELIKQDIDEEKSEDIFQINKAKYYLLKAIIYIKFLKNIDYESTTDKFILFKHRSEKSEKQFYDHLIKKIQYSALIFEKNALWKLFLKTKLVHVELLWEQQKGNLGKNLNYFVLMECKNIIGYCLDVFMQSQYKLGGFSEFEKQIQRLTKDINEKFWITAKNTIIFMRAVPINNQRQPIVHNLVRKPHHFKKQIEEIIINKQYSLTSRCSDIISRQHHPHLSPTRSTSFKHSQKPNIVDISVKFQILTRQKLKEQTKNGCSLMVLTTDVVIKDKQVYMIVEDQLLNLEYIKVDNKFVEDYNLQRVGIFILMGQNSNKVIQKLKQIMPKPPLLISLSQLPFLFSKMQTKQMKNTRQLISSKQLKTAAELQYIKQFIHQLRIKKIEGINDIAQIHEISSSKSQLVKQNLNVEIYFWKQSEIAIDFRQGVYKNLSPGVENNYNVDIDSNRKDFYSLRRWDQLIQTFTLIKQHNQLKKPLYINIFGQKNSGKTYFAQQIVRIFIERQIYSNGVYLLDGKTIEKHYGGDFVKYIDRESQKGRLPQLQFFKICQQRSVMLVIDDFHLIKRRSNSLYNDFLQMIENLKFNIIIVTNSFYSKSQHFSTIKDIKLNKLTEYQIDIIAYNIITTWDQEVQILYQQLRSDKQNPLTVKDVIDFSKKMKKRYKKIDPEDKKIMERIFSGFS